VPIESVVSILSNVNLIKIVESDNLLFINESFDLTHLS